MPIDQIRQRLHLQRKKNAIVFQNIERLWNIGKNCSSEQDILDRLHPWQAPTQLRFDNQLSFLLIVAGAIFLLVFLIQPSHILTQLSLLTGCFLFFFAYLYYESKQKILEVITYLEQIMIIKKYNLAYQRPPSILKRTVQPNLFISQLKQQFPLFNQGNLSNDIPFYASTIWQNEQGQLYQVMLFQYHFVNQMQMRDKHGEKVKIKELHYDQWGVFIFDLEHNLPTLAASTHPLHFGAPYHVIWQTSDIETNQRIQIFGESELDLAKHLTPALTLRLNDFFAQRKGHLLIDAEKNRLCFLGSDPIMHIQSKTQAQEIEDISSLRGHLRTFKLPYLERLERDLLALLK